MGSKNTFVDLKAQIDKLMLHVNQASIKTRHRYYAAVVRLCTFLAEKFHLEQFTNLQTKHLAEYTKHLLEKKRSAAYIKNELSAIRFFYRQSTGTNLLPDNEKIGVQLGQPLPKRQYGAVSRAWTQEEYHLAISYAEAYGDHDVSMALQFARTLGLRLHETARTTFEQANEARSTGFLSVKGKGGKFRDVPLAGTALVTICHALDVPELTGKVFVLEPHKTHQFMKRVENWIYRHRDKFTLGDVKLTYHGLRHTFAQERYAFHLNRLGGDELAARIAVSRELGHERDEVTRIYLAGFKEKGTKE